VFRMEAIDKLGQFEDYYDLERINEYIKAQK
jgi:hypothetical protein